MNPLRRSFGLFSLLIVSALAPSTAFGQSTSPPEPARVPPVEHRQGSEGGGGGESYRGSSRRSNDSDRRVLRDAREAEEDAERFQAAAVVFLPFAAHFGAMGIGLGVGGVSGFAQGSGAISIAFLAIGGPLSSAGGPTAREGLTLLGEDPGAPIGTLVGWMLWGTGMSMAVGGTLASISVGVGAAAPAGIGLVCGIVSLAIWGGDADEARERLDEAIERRDPSASIHRRIRPMVGFAPLIMPGLGGDPGHVGAAIVGAF